MRDKPNVLQKATKGEGKPRLDSGKNTPVPSIIFTPSAPAWGCFSIKSRLLRRVSSAMTVSGLSRRINSPVASRMAWLLAFEKPTLRSFAITCTSGKRACTICTDPSLEALSTTHTSTAKPAAARRTANKACSRKNLTL